MNPLAGLQIAAVAKVYARNAASAQRKRRFGLGPLLGPFRALLGDPKDPLARGASYLILNQAIVSGFGFVFWILAARYLPPSELGRATGAIVGAVLLGLVANAGLSFALVRELPTSPNPRALFARVIRLATVLGVAAALVGLALSPLWVPDLSGQLLTPVAAAAFAILVVSYALQGPLEQGLLALRRPELTTAMFAVFGAGRLPLLFLFGGLSWAGALAAWGVATAAAVVLSLFRFVPMSLGPPTSGAESPETVRALLGYGAANHAATVLGMAAPFLLSIAILGVIGGDQGAVAAATFYICFQLAQILYVIPGAVGLSQFAEGSRPDSDHHHNRRRAMEFAGVLVFPGVLVFYLLAGPLLSLFGPAYVTHGEELFRIMLIAAIPLVPGAVLAAQLRLDGRVSRVTVSAALVNIVALVGVFALLPQMGLEAVGWSFVAGQTLGLVVLWFPLGKARDAKASGADRAPLLGRGQGDEGP